MLSLNDAIYGLRNLSVLDEEETRVEEILPLIELESTRRTVSDCVQAGEYARAYELAIWPILATRRRVDVEEAVVAWICDWGTDDITIDEILAEYDRLAEAPPD